MTWDQFFDKLLLMLVSGTAPDVWYGEAGRAISWHKRRALPKTWLLTSERDLDLDDYFFLDAAQDPAHGSVDGDPQRLSGDVALLQLPSTSARAGLDVPRRERGPSTTSIAAAKKLTIPGADTCRAVGLCASAHLHHAGVDALDQALRRPHPRSRPGPTSLLNSPRDGVGLGADRPR